MLEGQGAAADPDALDDAQFAEDARRLFGEHADAVIAASAPFKGPQRALDVALRAGPYGDRFGRKPLIVLSWSISGASALMALAVGVHTLLGLGAFVVFSGMSSIGRGADTALVADLVPPEARERVFERFYRLAGDTEGTGLGLAIVREIATAWGAEVLLDRPPGTDRGLRAQVRFAPGAPEGA